MKKKESWWYEKLMEKKRYILKLNNIKLNIIHPSKVKRLINYFTKIQGLI